MPAPATAQPAATRRAASSREYKISPRTKPEHRDALAALTRPPPSRSVNSGGDLGLDVAVLRLGDGLLGRLDLGQHREAGGVGIGHRLALGAMVVASGHERIPQASPGVRLSALGLGEVGPQVGSMDGRGQRAGLAIRPLHPAEQLAAEDQGRGAHRRPSWRSWSRVRFMLDSNMVSSLPVMRPALNSTTACSRRASSLRRKVGPAGFRLGPANCATVSCKALSIWAWLRRGRGFWRRWARRWSRA